MKAIPPKVQLAPNWAGGPPRRSAGAAGRRGTRSFIFVLCFLLGAQTLVGSDSWFHTVDGRNHLIRQITSPGINLRLSKSHTVAS